MGMVKVIKDRQFDCMEKVENMVVGGFFMETMDSSVVFLVVGRDIKDKCVDTIKYNIGEEYVANKTNGCGKLEYESFVYGSLIIPLDIEIRIKFPSEKMNKGE